MDEGVKEALANEENTKRDALTRSDRQTLRCYFGFTKCVQIPSFPVKDKNSVNGFIRRMLFENNNESKDAEKSKRTDGRVDSDTASEKATKDAQNEEDDEPFDLNILLSRDVPTIFPWTLESLKEMFLEASRFTDNQTTPFPALPTHPHALSLSLSLFSTTTTTSSPPPPPPKKGQTRDRTSRIT